MSHIINNKIVDITTSSAFIIVFPFLIRKISLAIYFHCCRFSGAKWIGIYWRALESKTKHSPAQSKLEQLNYRIGEFNFRMLILFDFGFNFNGTQSIPSKSILNCARSYPGRAIKISEQTRRCNPAEK